MINYLYKFINRINYRTFMFYVIPISGIAVGLNYNFDKGNAFPSIVFFGVIIFQVIGPYLIGGVWLLMFSMYRGMIKIEDKNITLKKKKNKDLTDVLNHEVMTYEYYSKFVFYSWLVNLIILISQYYN